MAKLAFMDGVWRGPAWTVRAGGEKHHVHGPVTIRYTATITADTFVERGERIMAGREPLQIFEMNLKRVGTTTWPAADPIPQQ